MNIAIQEMYIQYSDNHDNYSGNVYSIFRQSR
jgi:hypothetical protein